MITYSIKDLERITGIKAHTIRIWEQRYSLIHPQRTDSNIRYYTNADLRYILNISVLNKNGLKISKIARLSLEEISKHVLQLVEKNNSTSETIDTLLSIMVDFDETRFENLINNNIAKKGLEISIETIIFPFLRKLGLLWQAGAVFSAQEHFISHLIRQKIISEINTYSINPEKSKSFILFLPEGEYHELSLLYYYYLLKKRGLQSIYLGQSLPFEDLLSAFELKKPETIILVITQKMKYMDLQDYFELLSNSFSSSKILVSGLQTMGINFELPLNITQFTGPDTFRNLIDA